MRTTSPTRIMRPALLLALLALAVVALGTAVTSPAGAAELPVAQQRNDVILRFGEDVYIRTNQQVDAVIAFGGDVEVAGTVTDVVLAFGGDVRLAPTAQVGSSAGTEDPVVVSFGGEVTRAPGAVVNGSVKSIDGSGWREALNLATRHTIIDPWWGFSFIGWVVQTAFFLVLALVVAALMPNQLRAVQRSLAARPGPSFGWGALTFFIIGPASLVVLIISIVGLLLVLPYIVFVLLAYFFVTTAVGAFIAQRLLSTGGRTSDNLVLAVTLGVLGTTIVSRIPGIGALAILVMMVAGTGAAVLAFVEWRRGKKLAAARAVAAPGPAPVTPGGAPSPPASAVGAPPAPPSVAAPPLPEEQAPPAAEEVAVHEAAAGQAPSDGAAAEAAPDDESPAEGGAGAGEEGAGEEDTVEEPPARPGEPSA